MSRDRLASIGLGLVGAFLFLAAWQVIGQLRLLGLSWPALTDVLGVLLDQGRWTLFGRALSASLVELAEGYCAGWVLGLGAALVAHLAWPLRPGLDRLSAVLHAIPSVALAPVLIVLVGREATPAALAALSTFFALYVAAASGFTAVPPVLRDLMTVTGASRMTRLIRLDLPAALPVIVSGSRLAAPPALIGVIVGEWFGAPRGLGVVVINAMQNFQITLLWSVVVLAVCVSLILYGLLGLLQSAAAARFR